MGEAEAPPGPTSRTKYMGTTPGAGGKRTARSGTPGGTASRGKCLRVHAKWDGQSWLLTPPTGFVSACSPPSHTGYMAARPGTSTHGCFRPERPRPATPLGMHPQTPPAGSRAAGGAQRGRTLPAGPGAGPHVFCMGGRGAFGLFHTNCMMRSPMYGGGPIFLYFDFGEGLLEVQPCSNLLLYLLLHWYWR